MSMIRAPWTHDQIASLNAYQSAHVMHPFTCAKRGDDDHRFLLGDYGVLLATADGWICIDCDYRQDWAHTFMTDWSWREPVPDMMHRIYSTVKVATGPGQEPADLTDEEILRYYDQDQAHLVADLPPEGQAHVRRQYLQGVRENPRAMKQIAAILNKRAARSSFQVMMINELRAPFEQWLDAAGLLLTSVPDIDPMEFGYIVVPKATLPGAEDRP